jgi:uncharacterized membrane protein
MDAYGIFGGIVGLLIVLFLFVLGILWLLVPFAVFGIKGLLSDLIREQRRTNALLAREASLPTPQEDAEADRPTLKNILAEIQKP